MTILTRPRWRPTVDLAFHQRAACNSARHPEVDPAWFAPLGYTPEGRAEDEPQVRRALAVCARCPLDVRWWCGEQRRLAEAEAGGDDVDEDGGPGGVWAERYYDG